MVYLADTTDTPPRPVVIKMLNAAGAHDREAVARFDREAKQLKAVSHENIVKMLGHGHAFGRAYIVMEYIRGESLRELLSTQGALTLPQFVPIAAQILKAVGHVHSRGIMVRDIKPANIMLCRHRGRDNFVKLLDFGLAKLVGDQDAITTAHIVGTIGYLSPEQIQSKPFDLRVDVFALGVLFYHCLSGQLPYRGETPEGTLYATVHNEPTPLAEVLPTSAQMTPELEDLIMRCIDQNPDRRPAHADEVVEGLIDAVPASLFRLPKAAGPITSTMTTGSLRLDEHHDRPSPPPGPQLVPAAQGETLSIGTAPVAVTAPDIVVAESVPTPTSPTKVWGIAAAAALLAGTVVWFSARSPSPPAQSPATAEASTPSAPSASKTTLEVSVDPPATIYVDGEAKGIDPGTIELSPGTHEVRAEADGYRPWSKPVVIEEGKPLTLQIALTAATPEDAPAPADDSPDPVVIEPDETDVDPTSPSTDSHAPSRSRKKRRHAKKSKAASAPEQRPDPPPASSPPTAPPTSRGITPGDMPRRRPKQKNSRALDNNVW